MVKKLSTRTRPIMVGVENRRDTLVKTLLIEVETLTEDQIAKLITTAKNLKGDSLSDQIYAMLSELYRETKTPITMTREQISQMLGVSAMRVGFAIRTLVESGKLQVQPAKDSRASEFRPIVRKNSRK